MDPSPSWNTTRCTAASDCVCAPFDQPSLVSCAISLKYLACLQYLLLTDNDEKVPNTAACPVGVSTPQCSPGQLLWMACLCTGTADSSLCQLAAFIAETFRGSYSNAGFFDEANVPEILPSTTAVPRACCPGYFCPPILTCMIPCPLGASCSRYRQL